MVVPQNRCRGTWRRFLSLGRCPWEDDESFEWSPVLTAPTAAELSLCQVVLQQARRALLGTGHLSFALCYSACLPASCRHTDKQKNPDRHKAKTKTHLHSPSLHFNRISQCRDNIVAQLLVFFLVLSNTMYGRQEETRKRWSTSVPLPVRKAPRIHPLGTIWRLKLQRLRRPGG